MRKILILLSFALNIFIGVYLLINKYENIKGSVSGAPPYSVPEDSAPQTSYFPWLYDWKRPNVPAKVALQVGHYQNNDFPDELEKLRNNHGAEGGGKSEWEVNLGIAEETKRLLNERGIDVDILPATVPHNYWADVFIAIHADGSEDVSKKGFKIAPPWRDFTKNADELVDHLYKTYSEVTGLPEDDNITVNMRGYYAFAWWRYEHAIHPMTTAVIIETGFLTNASDRKLLINSPEISAKGIADGIINFLIAEKLLV